ncbi:MULTISPECIES: glycoside hydrolase family 99-like domain-containing protein [unclassified Roseateles]|uniref:glycoside hydrolase family 99-like domain-containing protein n=1 Tax=unclassified Roseateles TaxID=2626991 RepID=UPI0006F8BBE2|nr:MULTISPECIES: glycoside hydrolase family 99-like domain-containing protein [unclassified Roseateles]KQW41974.1 hypothetical protein ASC81_21925 [Pelomonas sp. Root405]KRA67577.1 hypothetical protein ASD88_23510 [Pelomonas sp. Root662]
MNDFAARLILAAMAAIGGTHTTTAAADDAAAPTGKGSCRLHESKSFGDACYAAANARLADGGNAQFPNTRPGYRGSITASCSNGTVTWTAGECASISKALAKAGDAAAAVARSSTATAAASPVEAGAPSGSYRIGTYYFPGWKSNQLGNARKQPWDVLKLYTDREPKLGWYSEDGPGVMDQQLRWMRDYGIDYVVFDFLWSGDNRPLLTAGIDAYLRLPDRRGVQFSVLWTNHTRYTFSKAQFETLFTFWATQYFKHPDYLKIDGKPAVFIFSAETLDANARAIGMTSQDLIALAETIAKPMGIPGIAFIGASTGSRYNYAGSGYQGFSAYNYHSPAAAALAPARPGNLSRSFVELDAAYQDQWSSMRDKGVGLYVLPMTSGWDKRPWGGSKDPLHDDSRSTPAEFRDHLLAARRFMDGNPTLTRRLGVICCWNEFGEGSFIEPTKVDGMKYLEQIRDVFGAK